MTRRDWLAVPFVYRKALPGYRYQFPRDHFEHRDFRTEWWYYTGNIRTAQDRPFGYELTFFRQAVARNLNDPSPWAVEDVYLAHLALSDIQRDAFYHVERLNRAGPGIAGASLEQLRVWNGNWQVRWRGDTQQLIAVADDFSLHLDLAPAKPPVIHGRDGLSQKQPGQGEASHYISFTRLDTRGELHIGSDRHAVAGLSWMDHEFFSHTLGGELSGWDWFSLQFDNGSELMLYRLRRKDGRPSEFSSGTFVDRVGRQRHLKAEEFSLQPLRTWRSTRTVAVYPIDWIVRVPSLSLDLEIKAAMDKQELVSTNRFSPTYWEGAIRVTGTVTGVGYLEMTGYDRPISIGEP